ncbi:hypothetical protein MTO96_038612 [Rhipicephalus appendiculatus]
MDAIVDSRRAPNDGVTMAMPVSSPFLFFQLPAAHSSRHFCCRFTTSSSTLRTHTPNAAVVDASKGSVAAAAGNAFLRSAYRWQRRHVRDEPLLQPDAAAPVSFRLDLASTGAVCA